MQDRADTRRKIDGMDTRVKSVEETLDIIVKGESDNDYA